MNLSKKTDIFLIDNGNYNVALILKTRFLERIIKNTAKLYRTLVYKIYRITTILRIYFQNVSLKPNRRVLVLSDGSLNFTKC